MHCTQAPDVNSIAEEMASLQVTAIQAYRAKDLDTALAQLDRISLLDPSNPVWCAYLSTDSGYANCWAILQLYGGVESEVSARNSLGMASRSLLNFVLVRRLPIDRL